MSRSQQDKQDDAEAVLQQRARALACKPVEECEDLLHLLIITLHAQPYGIELEYVKEVQPLRTQIWSPVPCTPAFILGVVNLRGLLHPLIDLATFLGLPSRPLTEKSHLVVLARTDTSRSSCMELCLATDMGPTIISTPRRDVSRPFQSVSLKIPEWCAGVMHDMLVLLDAEQLLTDTRLMVDEQV